MDPNSIKSALESINSNQSTIPNTTSTTPKSTSTSSKSTTTLTTNSNVNIKQPIIPKRKRSSVLPQSTSSTTTSNSNASNLLGASISTSKLKTRGSTSNLLNPLSNAPTSTNSKGSSNSEAAKLMGMVLIEGESGNGASGNGNGNDMLPPPPPLTSIHRNTSSSSSNSIERKNSKSGSETIDSTSRFPGTSSISNSTENVTSTSPLRISNSTNSPPPPPTGTMTPRYSFNPPELTGVQAPPSTPNYQRSYNFHPSLSVNNSSTTSSSSSTTATTIEGNPQTHNEIDDLGKGQELADQYFRDRQLSSASSPIRDRNTGMDINNFVKPAPVRVGGGGGLRRIPTLEEGEEEEGVEDIVLVDGRVGVMNERRRRRNHSREIIVPDLLEEGEEREGEGEFKAEDQEIDCHHHYQQHNMDEYDQEEDGIDSLRMGGTNMGRGSLKRIGEEDLESRNSGAFAKYRMLHDQEGRSFRSPQIHSHHFESRIEEQQPRNHRYNSPLNHSYSSNNNDYRIQRSHSPFPPPPPPQNQHRNQNRPLQHEHSIQTTTVKFDPLSSLTSLFPGELNPHYHLANLRLERDLENVNDGIEDDDDNNKVGDREGGGGGKESKGSKWENCTMEEWEKGGEELKEKFSSLMTRMIDIVIRKANRTKEYEKRMEEHQIALKEREQAIAGTWSNVGSWAGELVGLK